MSRNGDLVRRLRTTKGNLVKEASERALAGGQIDNELASLERYNKLLSSLDGSSKSNWRAAVLVGLACLLAASFAWVKRIASVNIYGTITTEAVAFQLADDWQNGETWRLGKSLVRLDEFSEIGLPPELSSESRLNTRAWVDVDGANASIGSLEFSKGGRLSIFHASAARISLLSVAAPFRGQAYFLDEATVKAGDGGSPGEKLSNTNQFGIPASVTFYSDGVSNVPARLRFGVGEKIVFRDIPIRGLSFLREGVASKTSSAFVSGISSGSITIAETNEKIVLDEAERLKLGALVGSIRELEIGPSSLRLSFQGESNVVSIGPVGFEQNIVPTWMSYLYRQQQLSFFWGALVFLWSLLWSTRELLFK